MLDKTSVTPYNELHSVVSNYRLKRDQGFVSSDNSYEQIQSVLSALKDRAGTGGWDLVWEMVEYYLDNSVNTDHPQFFNQLWAGQSDPATVGAVVESLANTSMYTFEMAPVATVVENEMRSVFTRHFGLNGWDSQVTTGGSNSNFLALVLALNALIPNYKDGGLPSGLKPRVYVSNDAHYSFDKAVMLCGLGLDALVKVPVDDRGAMQSEALARIMHEDVRAGFVPILVAGTAGTTVRGAFDPFAEIADIATKNRCWFHIDGAWGGAIHYASDSDRWLRGSSRADSFSWDAHKMLGVPLMCSFLFVRKQGAMEAAFQLGDTSYIFHDSSENHDLGTTSVQCGRRVDALKMWLEYLYYGEQGFRQRIDRFLDLAAHAEKRINNEPELELQAERWINNICFRSRPRGIVGTPDINAFNARVRERLKLSGQAMVNKAYLGDELTVRLVVANKNITAATISRFFDLWLSEARKLEREMQ